MNYGTCGHWRAPVQVGRFVVTCSSLSGGDIRSSHPDFGIYLSPMWKDKLGVIMLTTGTAVRRVKTSSAYPALIIDWADMGTIPVSVLEDLVEICLSKMRAGKRIDIGCMVGHGRTGTLLACLIARVEYLTALEAVAAVRIRYCPHACETISQEELVARYVARHWRDKRWCQNSERSKFCSRIFRSVS